MFLQAFHPKSAHLLYTTDRCNDLPVLSTLFPPNESIAVHNRCTQRSITGYLPDSKSLSLRRGTFFFPEQVFYFLRSLVFCDGSRSTLRFIFVVCYKYAPKIIQNPLFSSNSNARIRPEKGPFSPSSPPSSQKLPDQAA